MAAIERSRAVRAEFDFETLPECLLGRHSGHIPLAVTKLEGASVLWLNRQAAFEDPLLSVFRGDISAYTGQLVARCAVTTATDGPESRDLSRVDEPPAIADRYGGQGIGSNGGSGRSAIIGGYYVKGIGRTPLLGTVNSDYHVDGMATVDECVLEAIYSEIVRAEFPHSAVPALAILGTGTLGTVVRGPDAVQRQKRRALLVRPCFLRPAHFERATGYLAARRGEGAKDSARVQAMFALARSKYGHDGLCHVYNGLWQNWAEQLGYAFAHRLPHGSPSTSNLCLDARLVDFGETRAVPSWARIANTFGRATYGDEISGLASALRSLSYYFGRYLDANLANPRSVANAIQCARTIYERTVNVEFLRLLGLGRAEAMDLMHCEEARISRIIANVRSHFRVEMLDGLRRMPTPLRTADLDMLWSDVPPRHLRAAREFLQNVVPTARHAQAAGVCRFRTRPRAHLYRDALNAALTSYLDQRGSTPQAISRFIESCTARGRRDCRIEPDGAVPIGFAVGADATFALFKRLSSTERFAVAEWIRPRLSTAPSPPDEISCRIGSQYPVNKIDNDSIELGDGTRLTASVSVYDDA